MRKYSPDNDPSMKRNREKERKLPETDSDTGTLTPPPTLPSPASEESSLATLSPDYLYNYNLAKRVDVLRSYKKLQIEKTKLNKLQTTTPLEEVTIPPPPIDIDPFNPNLPPHTTTEGEEELTEKGECLFIIDTGTWKVGMYTDFDFGGLGKFLDL